MVDILLAVPLVAGGVVGAQLGTRLRSEKTRILLSVVVVPVRAKIGFNVVRTPLEPFSMSWSATE